MPLNMKKMKELQAEFELAADIEYQENLKAQFLDFVHSEYFQKNFIELKSRGEIVQSSRVINNWKKEGLLDEGDNGKWRKYTRLERIWIKIVTELRNFGYPLDKIKNVRKQLFESKVKRFIPIEYAIMYSVIKEPMMMIIFEDGEIKLMPRTIYIDLELSKIKPHILLDFLRLIVDEFPNNTFDKIDSDRNVDHISDDELQLLYFIRSGDYETIKIRMKEGEIMLLEAEKELKISQKIIDVIRKRSYQDITIKTHNGQIVNLKTVEKIKPKAKTAKR